MKQTQLQESIQQFVIKYLSQTNIEQKEIIVSSNPITTISAPIVELFNGMTNEAYGEPQELLTSTVSPFQMINALRIVCPKEISNKPNIILPFQFCNFVHLKQLIIENLHCQLNLQFGSLKDELINLQIIGCVIPSIQISLFLQPEYPWKQLKKLALRNCGITKIPPKVFNQTHFPKLEWLDLSYNSISVLENIADRPLDTLLISNNKIQRIKSRYVGSISTLNLDHNSITSITNLSSYFNLVNLSIQNNKIFDYNHLKETFSKMYSLVEVSLKGNPIATHPEYRLKLTTLLPAFDFGMDIFIDKFPLTNDEKTHAIVALQQQNNTIYNTYSEKNEEEDNDQESDDELLGTLQLHEEDINEKKKEEQTKEIKKIEDGSDEIEETDVLEFLRKKIINNDYKFLDLVKKMINKEEFEKIEDQSPEDIKKMIESGKNIEIDKSKVKSKGKLRVIVSNDNVDKVLQCLNEPELKPINPFIIDDKEEDEIATNDDLTNILKNYKLDNE
ncbi:leucine-rich repeat containing protein [Entamoeba nuttalli P19]|uniref:Leucine-rich repeat containing protein n=1 Tax=Entamoeba nuttalli (strain P19) TaxID=1076696 RepID=K2HD95_ENTNP|nr:leucine-rich repeat containing protein [Entamoeba nuttalli P19]EKE40709.1 leucine-rich repeat containing protein [Entamoeba nuttalli P19]|eukprot:XP_008856955.1 leucine-rich repeat containing protein [Entamoeba nuttalli P19]